MVVSYGMVDGAFLHGRPASIASIIAKQAVRTVEFVHPVIIYIYIYIHIHILSTNIIGIILFGYYNK